MKRMISAILVIVLALSLSACGSPRPDPADPAKPLTKPTQSTEKPTVPATSPATVPTQPTECGHVYELTATKEATCAEEGHKIFTCSACAHSYQEAIAKLEHTYADATCTAPKTCTVCGATEGETKGHDFADATCTAPKTCATCGATDGKALGHDYKEGKCARCGAADKNYFGLMDCGWAINALNEDKTQIESIVIRFYEGGMAMLGAGIYDKVPAGEGGDDAIVIDGVEYAYAGFGIGGPVSYETDGDTITIIVEGKLTLKRSSGNTLTVVSIEGYVLVDYLHVGDVLKAK